jgi:hypothetical protein
MKVRALALCIVGAVIASSGCGRKRSASCPAGDVQLVYEGDSQGRGVLRLSVTPEGIAEAVLALEQPAALGKLSLQEQPKPAPLVVPATGRCSRGQVRLVLGSASGMISERFVLKGGVLEGTLTPELARSAFGYWQIDVHDTVEDRPRKMQGFWQQVKAADVAPPATKAAGATALAAPAVEQAITAASALPRAEDRASRRR